jgi:hypothetical protein
VDITISNRRITSEALICIGTFSHYCHASTVSLEASSPSAIVCGNNACQHTWQFMHVITGHTCQQCGQWPGIWDSMTAVNMLLLTPLMLHVSKGIRSFQLLPSSHTLSIFFISFQLFPLFLLSSITWLNHLVFIVSSLYILILTPFPLSWFHPFSSCDQITVAYFSMWLKKFQFCLWKF